MIKYVAKILSKKEKVNKEPIMLNKITCPNCGGNNCILIYNFFTKNDVFADATIKDIKCFDCRESIDKPEGMI